MSLVHTSLAQRTARQSPAIPLLPGTSDIALMPGRVHEASGPARRTLALWLAAQTQGPVIWSAPCWATERLNSDGVCAWIDPARLIFVSPTRTEDLLWIMEEVLRAGAVPLCVVDLPGLPNLTQVRRMHLAAEAGGQTGAHLPLGLLLTPGRGGAAGVETRWSVTPRHHDGRDGWQLDRIRARMAPCKSWQIEGPQNGSPLRIKPA